MRLAGADWGWSRGAARLVCTVTQRSLLEYAAPAWSPSTSALKYTHRQSPTGMTRQLYACMIEGLGCQRRQEKRGCREREVRQRKTKKSWRHRCQTVLEPLVEMPRAPSRCTGAWKCGFPGAVFPSIPWPRNGSWSTSARDSGESTGGGWEWLQVGSRSREQTEGGACVVVEGRRD